MLALALAIAVTLQVPVLTGGHAHNDYLHPRPLLDALDQGFCSVEADIFLVDGELRVGHEIGQTKPGVTLQKLYLDPLLERVRRNKGSVCEESSPFILLVDIKAKGSEVYAELRKILPAYREMLARLEPDVVDRTSFPGAVQLIISGDRPAEAKGKDASPYIFVDGRISDLDGLTRDERVPLISDNFSSHFSWKGQGPISQNDEAKLKLLVEKAHRPGRKIRFWAIPDSPASWALMAAAKVDLINTDKLSAFREWWQRREKGGSAVHFPMQKSEKIRSIMSAPVVSPVTSPN